VLYSKQVIHCDLKPENLLVSSDDVVKICDFGFSHYKTRTNLNNDFLGSAWYLAPELLLGQRSFNEKVDEWSVGVLALGMLMGTDALKGMIDAQGRAANPCRCNNEFHRNFDSDQAQKVLQLAGSPESLEGYACAEHIKSWNKYPRTVESTVRALVNSKDGGGTEADQWVHAINGLLCLSAGRRVSCSQTLKGPLFKDGDGIASCMIFPRWMSKMPNNIVKPTRSNDGSGSTQPSPLAVLLSTKLSTKAQSSRHCADSPHSLVPRMPPSFIPKGTPGAPVTCGTSIGFGSCPVAPVVPR
jgi:serine/threonine protein kinase